MQNLAKNALISSAVTPNAGAAGTTDIEGTVIDMAGFESVFTKVRMGAITANAVTSIKMQQGDESDGSDMADLTGTKIDIADDDDGEIFGIDLVKPEKRYVRLYVDRATANAVVADADYTRYQPGKAPITQGAGVTIETHVSPIEGTA